MGGRGTRTTQNRRRRSIVMTGMLGGMIALAVWGKLRFVSDVPRMAYADPKQDDGRGQSAAERPRDAD